MSTRTRKKPASGKAVAAEPVHILFGPREADSTVGSFARHSDYVLDRAMHAAMSAARTWAEFRELLPPGEFERLDMWCCNGGENVYLDGEKRLCENCSLAEEDFEPEYWAELVVRPSDAFSCESLPGFCDGDFPTFLDPLQDLFLPAEFCRRFGKSVDSAFSGSWWEFPLDQYEVMKHELEKAGFIVGRKESVTG
ncbi:MAG: hypothetical protein FJ170_01435 [Gammaproteobacteria bacterium]|nr:hypothetical protein [Gammaproteobacteria bacterium]